MSFDGLPVAMIDHTGAEGGDPDALLQRLTPIGFGREICSDLGAAERREWWIGNGNGAYAAGTVAQSLTRRYHGLLVAPVDPPLGRCLVLTKADAELVVADRRIPLFTNRWASGVVAPEGHLGLENFHLDATSPGAWWRREAASTRLSRWRSSRMGAIITVRPGSRALPRRSPPWASNSPCL